MKQIDLIYVIDDDSLLVMLLEKFIESTQFCTQTLDFENGQVAIEHLVSVIEKGGILPDVIFLDLNMPVMDGWQFLDEFSQLAITKQIPIFIITSSIDPTDMERAKNYEVVKDFVMKPVNIEKLTKIKAMCITT